MTSDDANPLALGQISFRQFADAMPQMVWSTLPNGAHDYYNAQWYAFTGAPVGSTDGDGWNDLFHPEDQGRAWDMWRHSLASGEPYTIEYRLRHHSGGYRWTLGRALPIRDSNGLIIRWVGTCTDIHEHKLSAQLNEILSRELNHRIKNIFAVINGIVGISAHQVPLMGQFAHQLQARIAALGRAHDYVRPHSEESAPHGGPRLLSQLLRQLLQPYPALDKGLIAITGDDFVIDDQGATPVGLAFNELATNSVKYGALATFDGRINITIATRDGAVDIVWQESGGPPVTKPKRTGFGTQLTDIAIVSQLGGTIERNWDAGGLRVEICVLAKRLSRTG